MNHVTHKTALSLKAAGFLPVEIDLWQVWYEITPELEPPEPFFLAGLTAWGYSIARANEYGKKSTLNDCVFAPTAVELLELLPPETLAGIKSGMWSVMPGNSPMVFTHRNLAEAAAMAWMALNKKT
jgi:hypothetical protein